MDSDEDVVVMSWFKVRVCPHFLAGTCSRSARACFDAHGPPQRRALTEFCYSPRRCRHGDKCASGDRCRFAHSDLEMQYHPVHFRTLPCDNAGCSRAFCSFAHGKPRKPTPTSPHHDYALVLCGTETILSSYKVLPCEDQSEARGGPQCGCRDFKYHSPAERRRPLCFYQPIPCQEANRFGLWHTIVECERGDSCDFAHSRFEVMFHPLVYKTRLCTRRRCQFGRLCSHAHSFEELRSGEEL